MKVQFILGTLGLLLLSTGKAAYAEEFNIAQSSAVEDTLPDMIHVKGSCELKSPEKNEVFNFDVPGYATGFTYETQSFPLTVDGKDLKLTVSHSGHPTWYFGGRKIPEGRGFGAALRDAEGTTIAGKSTTFPYSNFHGQNVAIVLDINEKTQIKCFGTALSEQ